MRYNFAAHLSFFAKLRRKAVQRATARIHAFSATSTANAPLDASTRPRRERTVESKVPNRWTRATRAVVQHSCGVANGSTGRKPSAGHF